MRESCACNCYKNHISHNNHIYDKGIYYDMYIEV